MNNKSFEFIEHERTVLAIIIRKDFTQSGIHFFTPEDYSQQLGYMKRDKGYAIEPHRHNVVDRQVKLTQEVLFIKSGKVRVDFYSKEESYLRSAILVSGDIILLADGGHGFQMLEESEILEVKQGPYCGENDKVHFRAVSNELVSF